MRQPRRASALQEIHRVARAATPTHLHLRSRIASVIVATVLLDAVASVLIFWFERDESGTEITSRRA